MSVHCWYSVMSRGNGGEVISRADEDRRQLLGRVPGLPERCGTEIRASILTENHQDGGRDDGGGNAASRLAIGGYGAGGAGG